MVDTVTFRRSHLAPIPMAAPRGIPTIGGLGFLWLHDLPTVGMVRGFCVLNFSQSEACHSISCGFNLCAPVGPFP